MPTSANHVKPASNFRNILIDNIPFSCASWGEILESMDSRPYGSRNYISITNTESLHFAFNNLDHRKYIQGASFSCCDGVGILLAAKRNGFTIPRLHGPDLLLKCCEFGQLKGWKHFFYGGKQGVPELLSRNLKTKYPKMRIVGAHSPPFRKLTKAEDAKIIEMINDSGADIVWVGLGLLKQEKWIIDHLPKSNARWMIGVGAAFDFHAGTVTRAPRWVQAIGLEWFYRAILEPRMWIRHARAFRAFSKILINKNLFRLDISSSP